MEKIEKILIKSNEFYDAIRPLIEQEKVQLISDKDMIIEMKSRVSKVQENLEELKKRGISVEVMERYLHDKTHVPRKSVKLIMSGLNQFFKEVNIK